MEKNYKLTIAYDGTRFFGWEHQPDKETIQGKLEAVLERLQGRPVDLIGAGRTDAGVHARGQVVSFDIDECELRGRTPYNLRRSLNALTCEGIVVRAVEERPRGFSARFDAQWREYKYFLATGDTPPVFTDRTAWYVGPNLDIAAMERGATHLIGEHDFKSFCLAASAVGKPTCRNVEEISIASEEILGEPHRVITVRGNAFLHSMVRTIVGTLVMVGRGQRDPDWVAEVLAARDRQAAGENAPARGLIFWSVGY